jgi:hypothetical protein
MLHQDKQNHGVVLPHGKMTITNHGFPMDEDSWNALAAQASIRIFPVTPGNSKP